MGEVFGEEGVDLGVAVNAAARGREGVGAAAGGGEAEAAGRIVVVALVLLVAKNGLACDLEPPACAFLAALGRLQRRSDAVLDVAVGPARGRDVGPLLVLLVGALRLSAQLVAGKEEQSSPVMCLPVSGALRQSRC